MAPGTLFTFGFMTPHLDMLSDRCLHDEVSNRQQILSADFFTRTLSGGVITLVSSIIMLTLFFSELREWSSKAHPMLPTWLSCQRQSVGQHAVSRALHKTGMTRRPRALTPPQVT